MADPVLVTHLDDGAWWRVVLDGSKGNVLDTALMESLTRVFREARRAPDLKAMVIEGQGDHFSFGASVQEHLPDEVEAMLGHFRHLLLAMLDSSVVVLAAVRGQCLGGALELVMLCHRVFASHEAKLGQPEIALGVFPPAASVALTQRIGRAAAEDLCLTGRVISAGEALAIGLVDEIGDGDPAAAALKWAQGHLAARSASSLRLAVRAIRADLVTKIRAELPQVERLYLHELMKTDDALEGLHAFLEKRRPQWRNA
jgi:cyclohexa-1,5-dienecarbonyl-CoA hydratase